LPASHRQRRWNGGCARRFERGKRRIHIDVSIQKNESGCEGNWVLTVTQSP